MKVKVLIDCVGIDYDLKVGETVTLKKELALVLIDFGYVEEVHQRGKKEKGDE